MIAARTDSPDQTRVLAGALAELVVPGDVLVLAGDLGAGKTAFAQGVGRALGVESPITSPTFTLANRYVGRCEIHHLDVYRLEQLEEVTDLGLYELFDDSCVVLIEWGDAIESVLPTDYLEIRFTFGDGDDDRTLSMRPVGSRWAARERVLCERLQEWMEPESC